MTKIILAISCCTSLYSFTTAQDLIKCKITEDDKKTNTAHVYEYNATDSYGVIRLRLFQNGTFHYKLSRFNRDVFSEGNWVQKNDTLSLTSHIAFGNIPVKLMYSNDSSNLINGLKIGVVQNLKGEYLSDGLVFINNDSISCIPDMGFCTAEYKSIDSIKVVFENGMSSEWMKIKDKNFVKIIPVVQTSFLISSYMTFDNRKYRVLNQYLKPID